MINQSDQRVFITGYSAVTASGMTIAETWQSILNGESGIAPIRDWDLNSWPQHLGGELKHFQPSKMLPDRKLLKLMSKQDVMGLHAVSKAIEHSRLLEFRETLSDQQSFNETTGIYVGSPGNKYFQQYDFLALMEKTQGNMLSFAKELFSEVHPMWLLRILPNNVLAYSAITYGFKGPNHNITNHAVSSMQAILEAYYAIKYGYAQRAIVVSYDIGIDPQALFYYSKLGVISPHELKPFDKDHDGTILADGASAIILESQNSVEMREATCYAEMIGGGSRTEASGLFSIAENGKSLAELLHQVLKTYDIKPSEVKMVVAHGNGNPKSDNSEALALTSVFGKKRVPVAAFKWSTGHTLAASGILDTVFGVLALQSHTIPGIVNFKSPSPEAMYLDIASQHRTLNTEGYLMVINRGFASMNACLILKPSGDPI